MLRVFMFSLLSAALASSALAAPPGEVVAETLAPTSLCAAGAPCAVRRAVRVETGADAAWPQVVAQGAWAWVGLTDLGAHLERAGEAPPMWLGVVDEAGTLDPLPPAPHGYLALRYGAPVVVSAGPEEQVKVHELGLDGWSAGVSMATGRPLGAVGAASGFGVLTGKGRGAWLVWETPGGRSIRGPMRGEAAVLGPVVDGQPLVFLAGPPSPDGPPGAGAPQVVLGERILGLGEGGSGVATDVSLAFGGGALVATWGDGGAQPHLAYRAGDALHTWDLPLSGSQPGPSCEQPAVVTGAPGGHAVVAAGDHLWLVSLRRRLHMRATNAREADPCAAPSPHTDCHMALPQRVCDLEDAGSRTEVVLSVVDVGGPREVAVATLDGDWPRLAVAPGAHGPLALVSGPGAAVLLEFAPPADSP